MAVENTAAQLVLAAIIANRRTKGLLSSFTCNSLWILPSCRSVKFMESYIRLAKLKADYI